VNDARIETRLRVQGFADSTFRVAAVTGEEHLSDLYTFSVDALTDDAALEVEDRALGRDAALTFQVEDRKRTVHGVVARLEHGGHRSKGGRRGAEYAFEIVPRAHLLTLRKNSRVFQDMRVEQILREILLPYFIPVRFALREEYPVEQYTTQLEETDFAFVQRLAAEAGLFFFFEEPGVESAPLDFLRSQLAALGPLAEQFGGVEPREVLVFGDSPLAYPAIRREAEGDLASQAIGQLGRMIGAPLPGGPDPVLRVRDPALGLTRQDEMVVHELVRTRELRPATAVFGDYDARRPRTIFRHEHAEEVASGELPWGASRPSLREPSVETARAALSADARAFAESAMAQRPLEIYEHHARGLFPEADHEAGEAARRLRGARRDADLARGRTVCPWIAAGHWFRVEEHEIERLNRRWTAIAVRHEIARRADEGGWTYESEVTCVPAEVVYPAKSASPRRVSVCTTATVVGGEPVHTEASGMVQVRFHWDRENERGNRRSTCWLRLMQPWAGNGWGTQLLPRVGTEVVVSFENGNPDKPIVLGGVHNAHNPPPFALPEERSKSGIRTRTIGGDGSNELSFDDAQGRERVFLHAERDHDVDVGRDRTARIHHDERLHVDGDQHLRVDGATREEHVGLREVECRSGARTTVHGQRDVTTEGDESTRVSGTQRLQVDGPAVHSHRGRYQLVASSDVIQRIGGNLVCLVGGEDGARSHATRVEGNLSMSSSERIELCAEEEIVLRCGNSVLRLSLDQVEIASFRVVLSGEDVRATFDAGSLRIVADDRVQVVANTVLLKASGAALALSSEASVDGSRVLLNSPGDASDRIEPTNTEPTTVEITDQEGNPIPNQSFRILVGGREFGGATDGDGRAELDLTEGGEVEFPGLRGVEPS